MAHGVLNGHMIPKGQTRDHKMLKALYLKNSWRCYLATIAELLDSLL